jgi:hypothetical protein
VRETPKGVVRLLGSNLLANTYRDCGAANQQPACKRLTPVARTEGDHSGVEGVLLTAAKTAMAAIKN